MEDLSNQTPIRGKALPWPVEHIAVLNELALDNKLSSRDIAFRLNERFQTSYTRNSVVGRLHRMGTKRPEVEYRPPASRQHKPINRPILKVVRNGNPDSMRIMESSVNIAPIVIRCVEVEPKHVSILDLEIDSCRYPYGDVDFTFCGNKASDGKSYCAAHEALVYVPRYSRRWREAAE